MKIPYIKISQKNEVFFITKFKSSELKNRINFHFRAPYSSEEEKNELYEEYMEKLKRKGIDINNNEEGIQRRVQISRINKIKNYINEKEDSFFPTSVVLAADVSKEEGFEKQYSEIEKNDFGIIDLNDNIKFQIVDGQHRLAGLFISDESIQDNFEISAVLLFNATKDTCAKVFADINGNQTPVNRSVIFDLYEMMDSNTEEAIKNKNLHSICKKLNNDPDSPLYKHIKMLGVGSGAISQAFFIEYLDKAMRQIELNHNDIQEIYNNLFLYFKAFQRIFSSQWPVKEKKQYNNMRDFYDFSDKVLKQDKSQIIKTNGFGALMLVFPFVYNTLEKRNFDEYYELISKLKGKIDWSKDDILARGTGKKIQNELKNKLKKILGI